MFFTDHWNLNRKISLNETILYDEKLKLYK